MFKKSTYDLRLDLRHPFPTTHLHLEDLRQLDFFLIEHALDFLALDFLALDLDFLALDLDFFRLLRYSFASHLNFPFLYTNL
jgi:hypothetical protein